MTDNSSFHWKLNLAGSQITYNLIVDGEVHEQKHVFEIHTSIFKPILSNPAYLESTVQFGWIPWYTLYIWVLIHNTGAVGCIYVLSILIISVIYEYILNLSLTWDKHYGEQKEKLTSGFPLQETTSTTRTLKPQKEPCSKGARLMTRHEQYKMIWLLRLGEACRIVHIGRTLTQPFFEFPGNSPHAVVKDRTFPIHTNAERCFFEEQWESTTACLWNTANVLKHSWSA